MPTLGDGEGGPLRPLPNTIPSRGSSHSPMPLREGVRHRSSNFSGNPLSASSSFQHGDDATDSASVSATAAEKLSGFQKVNAGIFRYVQPCLLFLAIFVPSFTLTGAVALCVLLLGRSGIRCVHWISHAALLLVSLASIVWQSMGAADPSLKSAAWPYTGFKVDLYKKNESWFMFYGGFAIVDAIILVTSILGIIHLRSPASAILPPGQETKTSLAVSRFYYSACRALGPAVLILPVLSDGTILCLPYLIATYVCIVWNAATRHVVYARPAVWRPVSVYAVCHCIFLMAVHMGGPSYSLSNMQGSAFFYLTHSDATYDALSSDAEAVYTSLQVLAVLVVAKVGSEISFSQYAANVKLMHGLSSGGGTDSQEEAVAADATFSDLGSPATSAARSSAAADAEAKNGMNSSWPSLNGGVDKGSRWHEEEETELVAATASFATLAAHSFAIGSMLAFAIMFPSFLTYPFLGVFFLSQCIPLRFLRLASPVLAAYASCVSAFLFSFWACGSWDSIWGTCVFNREGINNLEPAACAIEDANATLRNACQCVDIGLLPNEAVELSSLGQMVLVFAMTLPPLARFLISAVSDCYRSIRSQEEEVLQAITPAMLKRKRTATHSLEGHFPALHHLHHPKKPKGKQRAHQDNNTSNIGTDAGNAGGEEPPPKVSLGGGVTKARAETSGLEMPSSGSFTMAAAAEQIHQSLVHTYDKHDVLQDWIDETVDSDKQQTEGFRSSGIGMGHEVGGANDDAEEEQHSPGALEDARRQQHCDNRCDDMAHGRKPAVQFDLLVKHKDGSVHPCHLIVSTRMFTFHLEEDSGLVASGSLDPILAHVEPDILKTELKEYKMCIKLEIVATRRCRVLAVEDKESFLWLLTLLDSCLAYCEMHPRDDTGEFDEQNAKPADNFEVQLLPLEWVPFQELCSGCVSTEKAQQYWADCLQFMLSAQLWLEGMFAEAGKLIAVYAFTVTILLLYFLSLTQIYIGFAVYFFLAIFFIIIRERAPGAWFMLVSWSSLMVVWVFVFSFTTTPSQNSVMGAPQLLKDSSPHAGQSLSGEVFPHVCIFTIAVVQSYFFKRVAWLAKTDGTAAEQRESPESLTRNPSSGNAVSSASAAMSPALDSVSDVEAPAPRVAVRLRRAQTSFVNSELFKWFDFVSIKFSPPLCYVALAIESFRLIPLTGSTNPTVFNLGYFIFLLFFCLLHPIIPLRLFFLQQVWFVGTVYSIIVPFLKYFYQFELGQQIITNIIPSGVNHSVIGFKNFSTDSSSTSTELPQALLPNTIIFFLMYFTRPLLSRFLDDFGLQLDTVDAGASAGASESIDHASDSDSDAEKHFLKDTGKNSGSPAKEGEDESAEGKPPIDYKVRAWRLLAAVGTLLDKWFLNHATDLVIWLCFVVAYTRVSILGVWAVLTGMVFMVHDGAIVQSVGSLTISLLMVICYFFHLWPPSFWPDAAHDVLRWVLAMQVDSLLYDLFPYLGILIMIKFRQRADLKPYGEHGHEGNIQWTELTEPVDKHSNATLVRDTLKKFANALYLLVVYFFDMYGYTICIFVLLLNTFATFSVFCMMYLFMALYLAMYQTRQTVSLFVWRVMSVMLAIYVVAKYLLVLLIVTDQQFIDFTMPEDYMWVQGSLCKASFPLEVLALYVFYLQDKIFVKENRGEPRSYETAGLAYKIFYVYNYSGLIPEDVDNTNLPDHAIIRIGIIRHALKFALILLVGFCCFFAPDLMQCGYMTFALFFLHSFDPLVEKKNQWWCWLQRYNLFCICLMVIFLQLPQADDHDIPRQFYLIVGLPHRPESDTYLNGPESDHLYHTAKALVHIAVFIVVYGQQQMFNAHDFTLCLASRFRGDGTDTKAWALAVVARWRDNESARLDAALIEKEGLRKLVDIVENNWLTSKARTSEKAVEHDIALLRKRVQDRPKTETFIEFADEDMSEIPGCFPICLKASKRRLVAGWKQLPDFLLKCSYPTKPEELNDAATTQDVAFAGQHPLMEAAMRNAVKSTLHHTPQPSPRAPPAEGAPVGADEEIPPKELRAGALAFAVYWWFLSHTNILCYTLFFGTVLFRANWFTAMYVVALFSFLLLHDRPPRWFWQTLLGYTECLILFKYLATSFSTPTIDGGIAFDLLTGPRDTAHDSAFIVYLSAFLTASYEFLVCTLLAIVLHRGTQISFGLWYDMEEDDFIYLRRRVIIPGTEKTRSRDNSLSHPVSNAEPISKPSPAALKAPRKLDRQSTSRPRGRALFANTARNMTHKDFHAAAIKKPLTLQMKEYLSRVSSRPATCPGQDLYLWSFSFDFMALCVIFLSGLSTASGGFKCVPLLPVGSNDDDDSTLFTSEFIVLMLIQLLLLIWDRIAYLTDSQKLKLALQYVTTLLLVVAAVQVFPVSSSIPLQCAGGSPFMMMLYLLKGGFLFVGGFQLARRYSIAVKHDFCTSVAGPYASYLYLAYRGVPLLFEFRTLLDWTFIPTTLEFRDYLKLEDVRTELYLTKCDLVRRMSYGRRIGDKQDCCMKFCSGVLLIIMLLFLVLFPMVIFSQIGAVDGFKENLVTAATVTLTFQSEQILAQDGGMPTLRINKTYPFYRNKQEIHGTSVKDSTQADSTQTIRFGSESDTMWALPPPSVRHLNESLDNTSLILEVDFDRSKPTETAKMKLTVPFSPTEHRQLSQAFYFYLQLNTETDQQVANLPLCKRVILSHCVPQTVFLSKESTPLSPVQDAKSGSLSNAMGKPMYWTVCQIQLCRDSQSSRPVFWRIHQFANITNNASSLEGDALRRVHAIEDTGYFGVQDHVGISIEARSRKVIGGYLNMIPGLSGGITAFYVIVVWAVAQTIRLAWADVKLRMTWEDMPSVDVLFQMCTDIAGARQHDRFELEEELYRKLVNIVRSPHLLLQYSHWGAGDPVPARTSASQLALRMARPHDE